MPVCIAGMHRSGTSMVAKYLQACGLYLGRDEDLMPAAAENPEGFWEHLPLVAISDEVLNRLGGGWDCPPPEPAAGWEAGALAPPRARAATILAHFEGREPWGWKDPRVSLTLPFWRGLLPGLKTVIVVRNPLEVALSLRRRNGFSFALGLTLWHISYRRLLDAAPAAERLATHYDAYFGEPQTEIRRVAAFAGLAADDERLAGFATTVALRHHRRTADDLLEAEVSPAVFALYRELCEEAEWRDTDEARATSQTLGGSVTTGSVPSATSPLEAGIGQVSAATVDAGVWRREVEAFREALAGREARVAELEAAIREHEAARASLEGRVGQLEAAVAERDGKIAERDGRVAERDARLQLWGQARQQAERELGVLRQTAADQERHLEGAGRQVEAMVRHETELRGQLVSLHEQLLHKDAEVMATLGAALARHAPNAPAAAYYRRLLRQVRALVGRLPAGAAVAVASLGDEAMLRFEGRDAWHFPATSAEPTAAFKLIETSAALAQLDLLQGRGARYLVVPSPGQSWLARQPDLERTLRERFAAVADEPGVAVVFELPGAGGPLPVDGDRGAGVAA